MVLISEKKSKVIEDVIVFLLSEEYFIFNSIKNYFPIIPKVVIHKRKEYGK